MTDREPPRRQTILVVDDTPDNVLILIDLLRGICKVKVASSGSKALEIAGSDDPPDLILLDVMMPEMDGYQVCQSLKRNPLTREIPVLFVTSKSDIQNEARGFASGCADYITKPFSPALVLARVRTHLEQRRLLAAERERLVAERELLEKTLKGSLAIILEMISNEDPNPSGWHQRLGELAEAVARNLGLEEPWMVGLAGVLSRIGTLTVPKNVLEKVRSRMYLNSEEREAYNRIPEVGYRLLKGVPRLEEVAEMIYYSQKNYNGSGFPPDGRKGDDIPIGARILRICLDFTNTTPAQENPFHRVSEMFLNMAFYDAEAVLALKKIVEAGFFGGASEAEDETITIPIKDLMVGHVLDNAIETVEGQVLLRQGTVLTTSLVEKLANFSLIGAIKGPITVRI